MAEQHQPDAAERLNAPDERCVEPRRVDENVSTLVLGPDDEIRPGAVARFRREAAEIDVTVDVLIPFSRLESFLDWYTPTVGHFPLWCVPYRRVRDYEWLAPEVYQGVADDLFIDLAIYGMKQPPGRNVYKELEDALLRLGGVKTLISHNYYEPDVFWRIWNRANYDAVKTQTDPHNVFRDLYSKTCRAASGARRPSGRW